MATLAEVLGRYLRAQVEAGAQVVQLFDSWAGALAPEVYARAVLPWSARVLAAVDGAVAPRIHFATGNPALLPLLASAPCEAVSVDWRVGLDEAWRAIGEGHAVQGNLDPGVCLAPFEVVADAARDVLRRAEGRAGHVFNLGHGVLPETEASTLERLVDLVARETEAVAV
jgi:uroporphyrinogen decarboxylase